MDRNSVLITGCKGMLGTYADFGIKTDRSVLDVTNLDQVRSVCHEHKPKVILHFAAETDLAHCEKDPEYAYSLNTVGTYHMALVAKEIGALLVFVSTTSVFDGTKDEPYAADDTPNPINTYGHSKYLAECAVRAMLAEHLIVRITWVFGGGEASDKKFIGHILRQRKQEEIKVISDKYGSPVYAKDALEGIVVLLEQQKRGTVHLANSGVATRVDMAREALVVAGSAAKVVEMPEESFMSAYASGDNDSMVNDAIVMRPWRDALREYIETEWNI